LKFVQTILARIADEDVDENGFSTDKDAIDKIFSMESSNPGADILLRLTVVDSMYSTQMNRRYYGLDELAESLLLLSSQKKKSTKDLFIAFTKKQDSTLFDFTRKDGQKTNLFSERYGIGKDGRDKGIAISLISKYAYFETGKNFPIYDSIACEIYPLLWSFCGFPKKDQPKLIVRLKGSQDIDAVKTMCAYVDAINVLVEKLGGGISYDYLDRLLWFTGKIRRGNLSLVLSREQYINYIDYAKIHRLFKETEEFDIEKVKNVQDLPFLEKDSLLKDFFELAKLLK